MAMHVLTDQTKHQVPLINAQDHTAIAKLDHVATLVHFPVQYNNRSTPGADGASNIAYQNAAFQSQYDNELYNKTLRSDSLGPESPTRPGMPPDAVDEMMKLRKQLAEQQEQMENQKRLFVNFLQVSL